MLLRTCAAASLVLAACADSAIVVGALQEVAYFEATPNRDLDILFVVDNSMSMLSRQASLAANFPRMMDALAQLDGGLPNLHIGVITPDMGTSAALEATPGQAFGSAGFGGCGGFGEDGALRFAAAPSLQGTFISDIAGPDGTRVRNYDGELRDVFAQIAQVGGEGCGFEQHLASMRRALANPVNAGFVRPEANLAVVIIADEDDCSALSTRLFSNEPMLGPLASFRCTRFGVECDPDTLDTAGVKTGCGPRAASEYVEDVQPFVDALVAVKGDPRKVMVSAIVGEPTSFEIAHQVEFPGLVLTPSCSFAGTTGPEPALPAVRLAAFLDAFPGRSQLTSICSDDLAAPLAVIGATAKKLVGDPCLDAAGLVDRSDEPGLQPACQVTDVPDGTAEVRSLPSCDETSGDCFEIVPDAARCPTSPDHLRVRIRRAGATPLATWTHVRCQVAE